MRCVLSICLLIFCPLLTGAQNTPLEKPTPEALQPIRIVRLKEPPVIDGSLDEEVWKDATVFPNFIQVQPGDNIQASKPTVVHMGFDANFLYVAFRAYDDKGKVRATIAKRDAVFDDDNVRILLDTFDDQRKAYILVFNPLGIQADGILTEGRGEDYSVDIVMESKGAITEDGYTVEVAIPFKSLRYQAGKGKYWGLHLFRRIKRFNNELDSWMPISRSISGFLNQAGKMGGLEDLSAGKSLEIIPSFTLSESGKRVRTIPRSFVLANPGTIDHGRFLNPPFAVDPGLNVKLGITPNITLDAAINPDFAQVEADETVVTANQRFPIFFEEKRPFFLEGIDIFQTSLQPVHTRAIIDPDYALKLTGKTGRNTFGILLASDNAPGDFSAEERTDPTILPDIKRFIGKNAHIGVLRLKRDLGRENTLGFLATTYNFIEKHNHLGGIDGRFRLDPQTTFDFQVLGTNSRRFFNDADLGRTLYRTGNGFGYSYTYDHRGRNLSYVVAGAGRTRDYRADVGFTLRTNTNYKSLYVAYNSDPQPKGRLTSWRIQNFTYTNFDWQGRSQIAEIEPQAVLNFPRLSFLGGGYRRGYERVLEEEFGRKRTPTRTGAFTGADSERSATKNSFFIFGGTTPNKKYQFSFRTSVRRGQFDYDLGAGRKFPRVSPAALLNPGAPFDPGPGNYFDAIGFAAFQPTDELRLTFSYTKSRLRRYDTGRLAFDDNIYSLRSTYQFTRFAFARARIDYTTLAARARGQFLFGWTPNPGTAFYIGYNDDLNYDGFSPLTGHFEPGLSRNTRTFFLKMSYLFRRNV